MKRRRTIRDGHWHPHVMFFAPQTDALTQGANLPGSQRRTLTRMDNEPNLFRVTKQSGLDLEKESFPPVEAEFFS